MATTNQSSQNIQPPESTPNPNMKNEKEEDTDGDIDQEDILSLCDLPIHSIMSDTTDNHDHQDSNPNEFHQNSSFSDDNQDNFEFFSEEWKMTTTNTTNTAATADTTAATTASVSKPSPFPPNDENIIFCEKMVPSKQPLSNANDDPTTLNQKTKKIPLESQEKKSSLIPWKSNSIFSKSKRDSKLLLVLLGLPPKIPTDETELMSDIKIRQSHRTPSTFLPSNGGGFGGDQEVVAVSRRRASENVLWRLIKAASCFGGQQRENDVV